MKSIISVDMLTKYKTKKVVEIIALIYCAFLCLYIIY